MVDEQSYNELDRYITGRMQSDERVAFESRLSADGNLKSELEWIVNATAAMKNSGRHVMKQHIASMLTGVPSDEIAKYKPAKNAKSFWKKWWWVITGAAILLVAAALVYNYAFEESEHEHPHHDSEAGQSELMLVPDSLVPDSLDSDSAIEPSERGGDNMNADSANKAANGKTIAVRETVDVLYRNGVKLDLERELTKSKAKNPDVDTANRVGYLVDVGGENDGQYRTKEKTRPMGVTTGYKPYPPYTYKLDDDLLLNAPYYSCTGFKWEGMGTDTVYMTTKDGLEYMLLRGIGVQELKPLSRH